jgi:hypothetical protein
MTILEDERDQVPDVCGNCHEPLRIVAISFQLLRTRALFTCLHCGLAYVEPERRALRRPPHRRIGNGPSPGGRN